MLRRCCLSLLLTVVLLLAQHESHAYHRVPSYRQGSQRFSISTELNLHRSTPSATTGFTELRTVGVSSTVLTAAKTNNEKRHDVESSFPITAVWIFGILPTLSLGLPLLLQANLFIPLFLAKRMYIYLLAITVVVVASKRGATEDSPSLGTRMIDLTRQALPSSPASSLLLDTLANKETRTLNPDDDERFQELIVLNEMEGSTQAVGLPLLVVSSLIASLFFVLLQNADFDQSTSSVSAVTTFLLPFWKSIQSLAPVLINLSNALVVALFVRAELKRSFPTEDSVADLASVIGAMVLVALAYLGPSSFVWPIQNLLCTCLAITVARAIQLPRLGPILLALSGLVLYDGLSVGIQWIELGTQVLLTQQNQADTLLSATTTTAAAATATAALTTTTTSAMKVVAMSKAGLSTAANGIHSSISPPFVFWQPGLFQVRIRGIISDLLGLGDAVFPSLLSIFCLRYDIHCRDDNNNKNPKGEEDMITQEQKKNDSIDQEINNSVRQYPQQKYAAVSYFDASIMGYVLGCLACELAPSLNTGIPALVFLVPSMFLTVFGTAMVQGNVLSFWMFDAQSNTQMKTSTTNTTTTISPPPPRW